MVTMRINGTSRTVDVEPDPPLLWVLRDELRLTGTKFGCGVAQCGACTVHVDGEAVRSCVTPAEALQGRNIVTIEGCPFRLPIQVFGGPAAAVRQARWALAPKDTRVDLPVPCGVSDATRRKTEATALTGRPATSAWRVVAGTPRRPEDLTPPGGCSDDGGRRPRASRRSGLDRRAPLLWAPVRPSPERGGSGNGGSR